MKMEIYIKITDNDGNEIIKPVIVCRRDKG